MNPLVNKPIIYNLLYTREGQGTALCADLAVQHAIYTVIVSDLPPGYQIYPPTHTPFRPGSMISLIYLEGYRFFRERKRSPPRPGFTPGVCILAGDPPWEEGIFHAFHTVDCGTEVYLPAFGMEHVVYFLQRVRDYCVFARQRMAVSVLN